MRRPRPIWTAARLLVPLVAWHKGAGRVAAHQARFRHRRGPLPGSGEARSAFRGFAPDSDELCLPKPMAGLRRARILPRPASGSRITHPLQKLRAEFLSGDPDADADRRHSRHDRGLRPRCVGSPPAGAGSRRPQAASTRRSPTIKRAGEIEAGPPMVLLGTGARSTSAPIKPTRHSTAIRDAPAAKHRPGTADCGTGATQSGPNREARSTGIR